jgi:hypothetical protein
MILKKRFQLNYINLAKYYNTAITSRVIKPFFNFFFFSLFMHKKLTYYKFFLNNKFYIKSTGQLFKKKIKKIKFFKKSLKSNGYAISTLNRDYPKIFRNIYIFFCKNFNYKNYL